MKDFGFAVLGKTYNLAFSHDSVTANIDCYYLLGAEIFLTQKCGCLERKMEMPTYLIILLSPSI